MAKKGTAVGRYLIEYSFCCVQLFEASGMKTSREYRPQSIGARVTDPWACRGEHKRVALPGLGTAKVIFKNMGQRILGYPPNNDWLSLSSIPKAAFSGPSIMWRSGASPIKRHVVLKNEIS